MSGSNFALNKLFTKYVFEDLVKNQQSSIYHTIINRYLGGNPVKSNREVISDIYSYMYKCHRNEYFYQNTLLNKLLLGVHSINTTTALTQIPVGKSKADFVLINGKAVVYEIKTELDNFERLKSQISDYYKAFTYVCVVTCEENYDRISTLLKDSPVGICILSRKVTLQQKRKPIEDNSHLSHEVIFKTLHKKEHENIIYWYYGGLPETPPVFYYKKCLEAFREIPFNVLYPKVLEQLKERNRVIREDYEQVPYELKSLMYFYNATSRDYSNLSSFLEEEYKLGR